MAKKQNKGAVMAEEFMQDLDVPVEEAPVEEAAPSPTASVNTASGKPISVQTLRSKYPHLPQ